MRKKTKENETRTCSCDLAEFCQTRSDEEIIEFVKADKECYSLLVNRYEKKLMRYVKRISGVTSEAAEDILQNVFLKVYLNLNRFDENNKFSSWIFRITHNETVNHWRKNGKGNHFVSLDENDFWKNIIPDKRDMGNEVSQKIDGEKVRVALERLNGSQKEALTLRYMEQLNYQEIAEKLEKPIGTVGTLINRGKRILQEELVRAGFSGSLS